MLSGTGSDGTLGQLAIKGAGVMATVQSPDSAEYDGMPRSAIDTGLVDLILPPNRDGRPADRLCVAMRKIFVLLRAHCGHDFPPCKPNSIYRALSVCWPFTRLNRSNNMTVFCKIHAPKSKHFFAIC